MDTPVNTGRKQDGKFGKGQSGNPHGRPAGARNRTTLAAEALLDGEAEELTRKVIELAREGDMNALRLCLDRIIPPRRDRPIFVDLPPLEHTGDAPTALAAILAAVASGQITLAEANELSKLIEMFIKARAAIDKEEGERIKQNWNNEKRWFESEVHRRSGFQGPPY
jgi:hypothetical protein